MTRPTMTQAEYARHAGLPRQRVHTLAREGRLVVDHAGAIVVEESDVMHASSDALVPNKSNADLVRDLADARLRSERGKAEKLELEAATLAEKLVSRRVVEREAADLGAQLRAALERMPTRLAAELVGLNDAEAIRRCVAKYVADLLEVFTAEVAEDGEQTAAAAE